jgi:hypothetical protein
MSNEHRQKKASKRAHGVGHLWKSFLFCLELLICTNTHFALDGGREHGTRGRMEKELFYEFYDRKQDVTALAC